MYINSEKQLRVVVVEIPECAFILFIDSEMKYFTLILLKSVVKIVKISRDDRVEMKLAKCKIQNWKFRKGEING